VRCSLLAQVPRCKPPAIAEPVQREQGLGVVKRGLELASNIQAHPYRGGERLWIATPMARG